MFIDSSSRVLVVDDFEMVRVMIRNVLNNLEIKRITEADSGQSAWESLVKARNEGDPYSIVFLDWNMPGMNGIELLEKCRQSTEFKSLPIIMVTAEAEKSQVIQALMKGANDYIVKPCSIDTLRAKIDALNQKAS